MTSRTSRWPNRSRLIRGCVLTAAIAVHGVSESTFAQRYSITPLPLPEGQLAAFTWSINIHGDMCGTTWGDLGRLDLTPVLWRDNRVIKLPFLPHPDSDYGWAWRMNDSGVIVGQVDGFFPQQAVMWPDPFTILPVLDRDSAARDINNSMVVAGEFAVGFLDVRGFIWKYGVWESLDPIEFIEHLNERNQIVGSTNQQSWRWENGRFIEPTGLHPGARVWALGINDSGVMVGSSTRTEGGLGFPVIWTDDVPREMPVTRNGPEGAIVRINNRGEAIGASAITYYTQYSTLWRHNLGTEIDDLTIGPNARFWEVSPNDINDAGQIAATIQYAGQQGNRAARLDPIDTGLTLWGMEPSRPGTRNVVQVNHATPGGRVSLLWGTQRGEPAPMNQCNGAMIDIVDPRLAATAVAGPDGRAIFNVFIPANVLGLYVLQAVDHRSCEVSPPAWALLKTEN